MHNDITILYVEDEVGIRESLSGFLDFMCNKLYIATDGVHGLELYKEHTPDIVISDIKMPKMNGIEMAKSMKAINPKQHIIFTTAHSESSYFIDTIEMHVDGYILKPVDLEKLEDKIENIIEYIRLKRDYKKQQAMLVQSEKMASLGEMFSNIAHQWRQPLSAISTCASGIQLQKDAGSLSDEYIDATCETITQKAQYLSGIIDEFNDFVHDKSIKKESNIKEIIKSALLFCELNNQNNNIKIVDSLDENIRLQTYPNKLKHALINILDNAKDALCQKGDVLDTIIENRYIFLTLKKEENEIVIVVKDNAGGIHEDIITKVFEPYFTTKHQYIGTGLGLYMTYNMVKENLNGKIQVTNTQFEYKDKTYCGAEFKITLPPLS